MKKASLSAVGCAVVAALAVFGGATQARADHGCGGYGGGYASHAYSYRPAPVYYHRPSYSSHSYRHSGYSHQRHSYTPSWSHGSRWGHSSRPSYGYGGHYRSHGRRH